MMTRRLYLPLVVTVLLGIIGIVSFAAFAGPVQGPVRESVGVDALPITGGTLEGDLCLDDNVELQLGRECSGTDFSVRWDGSKIDAVIAAATALHWSADTFLLWDHLLLYPGKEFGESAGTVLDFASTDGVFRLRNNAKTQGAQFYASAADELTLRDMAGTGAGSLTITGALTVAGELDSQAGRIINVTTVNDTNYTALVGDHLIAYTALTAARTVTLPDALCNDGRTFDVKDEAGAAATYNISIDPEGGTTVDGQASVLISGDYNSLTVYCRNSVWFTR